MISLAYDQVLGKLIWAIAEAFSDFKFRQKVFLYQVLIQGLVEMLYELFLRLVLYLIADIKKTILFGQIVILLMQVPRHNFFRVLDNPQDSHKQSNVLFILHLT